MPGADSRSSLASHTYPPFYACYLLKSLSSPRSRTTYIGSTPNPLRRIRQHNGELTQGAWKTRRHRPWVMVMIVYGFPSKLHALQFEWAWQHPEVSRHLREEFAPKRNAYFLAEKVKVLRAMLAHAPYKTWPLHVKIFHEEGVKAWRGAEIHIAGEPPLPVACRIEVELEGVDGKVGGGTGRQGGIEVNDETFAMAHVRKFSRLLVSSKEYSCSICGHVLSPTLPPLTTGLCPLGSCCSLSHLSCLARDFLQHEDTGTLMPRTGKCRLCGHRILWGDIIRGCYRRQKGGVVMLAEEDEEDEDEDEEEEGLDVDEAPPSPAKSHNVLSSPAKPRHQQGTLPVFSVIKPGTAPRPKPVSFPKASAMTNNDNDGEGDFFDIDEISSPSISDAGPVAPTVPTAPIPFIIPSKRRRSVHKATQPKPRRRLSIPPRSLSLAQPRDAAAAPRPKPKPRRPAATRKGNAAARDTSGEIFDLDNISSCSDD